MGCTCVQALDAMAEIQERHEAVKDLEESLADLHQIFLDMSILVDAQGEMLDNIEQQVGPTRTCSMSSVPFAATAFLSNSKVFPVLHISVVRQASDLYHLKRAALHACSLLQYLQH